MSKMKDKKLEILKLIEGVGEAKEKPVIVIKKRRERAARRSSGKTHGNHLVCDDGYEEPWREKNSVTKYQNTHPITLINLMDEIRKILKKDDDLRTEVNQIRLKLSQVKIPGGLDPFEYGELLKFIIDYYDDVWKDHFGLIGAVGQIQRLIMSDFWGTMILPPDLALKILTTTSRDKQSSVYYALRPVIVHSQMDIERRWPQRSTRLFPSDDEGVHMKYYFDRDNIFENYDYLRSNFGRK